jgi:tetratricopeptide (TPR) repeat protein
MSTVIRCVVACLAVTTVAVAQVKVPGLGQSTLTLPSGPLTEAEAVRLLEEGRFAAARDLAAALIEQANPAAQARLLRLLGVSENRLGHYGEAATALNRSLEISARSETATPEITIALLVELANTNLNRGQLDEARRTLYRALAIAAANLPPGHRRLASIHHSMGVLFWRLGNQSRAEDAFRMAMTITERNLGPDHADVAAAASSLGELLNRTGRHADAIVMLERGKTILERIYGATHPETITATHALAAALVKSAPSRAEVMLRDLIANWRLSQAERHPFMITFLSTLARSRSAQRDYRESGNVSAQALQMSKDIFGPEHPHTLAQIYEHALLLKNAGRRKESAALKREADRIWAANGYSELGRHQIDILAFH